MTEVICANTKFQYKQIEALADNIWRTHYTPIIGEAQVEYMLDKFQSAVAIERQIENGFQYFILKSDGTNAGYISIKKDDDILFLSKIYVLKSFRGKGIGKKAMQFIEGKAVDLGCKSITLTVNKNNLGSIKAYETMGFKKLKEIIIDIGNGFVMDDYKMEKVIE